jgi:hypothetical protein
MTTRFRATKYGVACFTRRRTGCAQPAAFEVTLRNGSVLMMCKSCADQWKGYCESVAPAYRQQTEQRTT